MDYESFVILVHKYQINSIAYISDSTVVSIPVLGTGDRGLIPRQRSVQLSDPSVAAVWIFRLHFFSFSPLLTMVEG